jgi:hypothetical protein
MFINYKRTVEFSTEIINAGVNQDDLITCAQKTTTGAPSATVGVYIPGAIVQNIVSGIVYSNIGTTASPVWGEIMSISLPNIVGIYSTNQPQDLTGSGAAQISTFQTRFKSTGVNTITLEDGTKLGQLKKISYYEEAGASDNGNIVPDSPDGFTAISLTSVGAYAQFIWTGGRWALIEYMEAVIIT